MKTIAVLTMFFLPATFISSLLGTNLFVLDTSSHDGKAAVPLTLFTLLVWWLYLQWLLKARKRRIAKARSNGDGTPVEMQNLSSAEYML